jgi:hypothetical protein
MPINESEATNLLRDALAPFRDVSYRRLMSLVGHSRSSEAAGPSGARYRLECFVSRAHSRDETVSVSAIASELRKGSWFPRQAAEGFCMLSDGSIR